MHRRRRRRGQGDTSGLTLTHKHKFGTRHALVDDTITRNTETKKTCTLYGINGTQDSSGQPARRTHMQAPSKKKLPPVPIFTDGHVARSAYVGNPHAAQGDGRRPKHCTAILLA